MTRYNIPSASRSPVDDGSAAAPIVEAEYRIRMNSTGNTSGKPSIESNVILLPAREAIADRRVKIALRFMLPITRQSKYRPGKITGKPSSREYRRIEQNDSTSIMADVKISFEISIAWGLAIVKR